MTNKPASKQNGQISIVEYGAKIDGVTNDSAAWQAAIDAAAITGGSVAHPGGGISVIDGKVLNPEAVDIYGYGDAIVMPGYTDFEIFIIGEKDPYGTPVPLLVDAAAGSQSITVPGTWNEGDLAFIVSDDTLFNTPVKQGQLFTIESFNAGVIEITPGLVDTYLASSNARIYPVKTVKDFTCRGLTFVDPLPGEKSFRSITLGGVRHALLEDLRFRGEAPQPIGLKASANVHIDNITANLNGTTPFSYGVSVGACHTTLISNSSITGARHSITTLYEQGIEQGVFMGGAVDTTVSNCTSKNSFLAGFDEHEGSVRTKFIGCQSHGSQDAGFQTRGRETKILDCYASNNTRQGAVISNTSLNATVSGCDFSNNETGLSTRAGGSLTSIKSNVLKNNSIGLVLDGSEETVESCTFQGNSRYAIQDQGATGVTVSGCLFIKDKPSPSQNISILNAGNAGTFKLISNNFDGYTSTNLGMFPATNAAGVSVSGNETI